MSDHETGFDDELDESWDVDAGGSLGFEALLTPFLGYEVSVSGDGPFRVRILAPSTPESTSVLVGVHSDCMVVQDLERYTIYPQASCIAEIPASEWEQDEFDELTE